MNSLVNSGIKWGQRALVVKIGRTALKRGGLVGLGLGAAAGVGYLAYNLYENRQKKRKRYLNEIEDVDYNSPGVSGEKTIVV